MNVTTAFLNGKLDEEVFMEQPEGFVVKNKEDLVCKLKRSIYGLKQSPRCWNFTLNYNPKEMGLVQSTGHGEPCLYTSSKNMFLIAVYVDDIVLVCKSIERIASVKKALAKHFEVRRAALFP